MRHVAAVAAVVVLVTACAASETDQPPAAFEPSVTPPSLVPTVEGPTAGPAPTGRSSSPVTAVPEVLDFTARRLDGGTFDGRELVGAPAVLWIWAPWCPRCNREAPTVAEALDRFAGEVSFVGMAGKDTDAEHHAFVERHGLEDLVTVVDDDGSLWGKYGISYQPAWVFIDALGRADVHAGPLYGDDLVERIEALAAG